MSLNPERALDKARSQNWQDNTEAHTPVVKHSTGMCLCSCIEWCLAHSACVSIPNNADYDNICNAPCQPNCVSGLPIKPTSVNHSQSMAFSLLTGGEIRVLCILTYYGPIYKHSEYHSFFIALLIINSVRKFLAECTEMYDKKSLWVVSLEIHVDHSISQCMLTCGTRMHLQMLITRKLASNHAERRKRWAFPRGILSRTKKMNVCTCVNTQSTLTYRIQMDCA